MDNQKQLTLLIVNHLKSQIQDGVFSEESLESVEVAIQCIESAYNLNPNESVNVETKLEKIVHDYFLKTSESTVIIITVYYIKMLSFNITLFS